MITHVTLVNLPVRDQDRSLDFFVNKLGMKVRTDQPYGPGARWIEVAPGDEGPGIVLYKVDDDAAYADLRRETPYRLGDEPLANVLLGCDDAAATAAQLRDAGVQVTDPQAEPWGTFILVAEPDGRRICITQKD
jgi:lactoylglutathione lyase